MDRFADEALIEVSSGNGGNGAAAFLREKYVPKGGPSGGDGGRGGSVIFRVQKNCRTLVHLKYKNFYKAQNGGDGEGGGRYGKNGENIIIPLPPGSVIKDPETEKTIHDFGREQNDFVFLKGGNGGWGNIHFKSSVNQAPHKALPGKPGESRRLKVELRIMADIGLVGFPNAGKSSLLDKFTNARPKIAPYPFTTKIPNLGVLRAGELDIIIADIPGLIEGASRGLGLGFRFLKHISRTAALAFVIDLSDTSFIDAYEVLEKELKSFSAAGGIERRNDLSKKKRILIGSKLDLDGTEKNLAVLKEKYPDETIIGISVFTGTGLTELTEKFAAMVNLDRVNQ